MSIRHIPGSLYETLEITGPMVGAEIGRLYEEILREKQRPEGPIHFLYDFRRADLSSLTGKDVQQLSLSVKKNAPLRLSGKSAFVASTPLEYGMIRMYQLITEDQSNHLIETFQDYDQAVAWLTS